MGELTAWSHAVSSNPGISIAPDLSESATHFCGSCTSGRFPKFVLHLPRDRSRTSESHGHWQIYDSSAAFDPKSLSPVRHE